MEHRDKENNMDNTMTDIFKNIERHLKNISVSLRVMEERGLAYSDEMTVCHKLKSNTILAMSILLAIMTLNPVWVCQYITHRKMYIMASEPLTPYLSTDEIIRSDCLYSHSSACWRRYIGSWIIDDHKLFLIGLEGYPDYVDTDFLRDVGTIPVLALR